MAQALLQALYHGTVRALLGGEHIGCPILPIQGVINVAHGHQLHPFQGLGHGGAVQGGNLLQSAAGGQELRAVLPGELGPQSRGSAHASIVGAAAPQAQDDFPPPPANRV